MTFLKKKLRPPTFIPFNIWGSIFIATFLCYFKNLKSLNNRRLTLGVTNAKGEYYVNRYSIQNFERKLKERIKYLKVPTVKNPHEKNVEGLTQKVGQESLFVLS